MYIFYSFKDFIIFLILKTDKDSRRATNSCPTPTSRVSSISYTQNSLLFQPLLVLFAVVFGNWLKGLAFETIGYFCGALVLWSTASGISGKLVSGTLGIRLNVGCLMCEFMAEAEKPNMGLVLHIAEIH